MRTLVRILFLAAASLVSPVVADDDSGNPGTISPEEAQLDLDRLDQVKSRRSDHFAQVRVRNNDDELCLVHWVDFDGVSHRRGHIPPGGEWNQRSYDGHVWLITDRHGKPRQLLRACKDGCEIEIRSRTVVRRRAPVDDDAERPFRRDPDREPRRVRVRVDGRIPGSIPVAAGRSAFPGSIPVKPGITTRIPRANCESRSRR